MVPSPFDYGYLFYADASIILLRKLDVFQNRALRIITGTMMSSPINSLEVESGIVRQEKSFNRQILIKYSLSQQCYNK